MLAVRVPFPLPFALAFFVALLLLAAAGLAGEDKYLLFAFRTRFAPGANSTYVDGSPSSTTPPLVPFYYSPSPFYYTPASRSPLPSSYSSVSLSLSTAAST